jgi:hypothetical protein
MLAGHFAVSLAAKRFAPNVSLGTLVAAAMAADLVWPIFVLAGADTVRFNSAATPAGVRAVEVMEADITYSHSLLTCVLLAVLLGAVYFSRRRDLRGSWVIGAAALSHWLLDFISHRPDMALAPGSPGRFGLGLWKSVPATLAVEGLLWAGAIVIYLRATRAAKPLVAGFVFWGGILLLTLSWLSNITAPPPANLSAAMLTSFVFFSLTVAWGYWVNRLRPSSASG